MQPEKRLDTSLVNLHQQFVAARTPSTEATLMRSLTITASVCGLLLVAAGAAGAHLIAGNGGGPFMSVAEIGSVWFFPAERWNSAMLYGFVHTLAALIASRQSGHALLRTAASWAFLAGVTLFSGVQIITLLHASMTPDMTPMPNPFTQPPTPFDFLGPLVPVGGIAFMAAWIMLGASALLTPRRAGDSLP
jgi:uncharacterized membrane protein YgdD (TMEM256/DUF423 family)